MKTTIYVREQDEPIFKRAQEVLGESISGLVIDCLKRKLQEFDHKPEEIDIDIFGENKPKKTVKFLGRWITEELEPGEDENSSIRYTPGLFYCAAITKLGKIAIHEHLEDHDENNYSVLDVYDNFENFENAQESGYHKYPQNVIDGVREGLGMTARVEFLDI